jgi:hypothetical protein
VIDRVDTSNGDDKFLCVAPSKSNEPWAVLAVAATVPQQQGPICSGRDIQLRRDVAHIDALFFHRC